MPDLMPVTIRWRPEIWGALCRYVDTECPEMSRAAVANTLLREGLIARGYLDDTLDWRTAIQEVAAGRISPLEMLIRAAKTLDDAAGNDKLSQQLAKTWRQKTLGNDTIITTGRYIDPVHPT